MVLSKAYGIKNCLTTHQEKNPQIKYTLVLGDIF
jgi:hypothetical protein